MSSHSRAARFSNHAGIHLLSSPEVVGELIAAADVGPRSLVLDLGAGPGGITAALAATGARILAVERDPAFVRALQRRFQAYGNVRIVAADLRTVTLPGRPFQVVASIPYALSTTILRRLLDPVRSPLARADLIVEWGFARRLTRAVPRDLETAWWASRYVLGLERRVPATAFRPAPRVDSAHLSVVPRASLGAGLDGLDGLDGRRTLAALRTLVVQAYAGPHRATLDVLRTVVPKRRAHRIATSTGVSPPTPAAEVTPAQWAALARAVAETPDATIPALPRALDRASHRASHRRASGSRQSDRRQPGRR